MPLFFGSRKDFRNLVRGRFPNPERIGCPAPEIVDALARHALLPDHPAAEHVATCSPCYERFLTTRSQIRRRRLVSTAAVLAICLVAAGLTGYLILIKKRSGVSEVAQTKVPYVMDLRGTSANRGVPPARRPLVVPSVLPKKHLILTLYPPLGWQAGDYEIQLWDLGSRPLIKSESTARFDNHILRMTTDFDLSTVAEGRYLLAIKTAGIGWRTVPVMVSR